MCWYAFGSRGLGGLWGLAIMRTHVVTPLMQYTCQACFLLRVRVSLDILTSLQYVDLGYDISRVQYDRR